MACLLDRLSALRERTLLISLVVLGYGLYLPIGVWTARLVASEPALAIDRATPFVPELIFVYGMLYPVAALPLVMPMERLLFRRVAAAYMSILAASYVLFFVWPVHMTMRPGTVDEESFAGWTIDLVYWADRSSNCFPSLHVSTALLAALCALKVHRSVGLVAVLLSVAISASTMFVKQHWFVDVAGGAVLAVASWWVLVRPFPASSTSSGEQRVGWLLLAQVLLYLLLWGLYAAGWSPEGPSLTGT